MYVIKLYKKISENVFLTDVHAPRVADKCLPGQFVIVRTDKNGERIPLTICDYSRENGTVRLVVQIIGATTLKMSRLSVGDCLEDIVGPLGNPSELIDKSDDELRRKRIVFIAGGVGTAPVFPQVKYLAERGFSPDVIIGAKTKNLITVSYTHLTLPTTDVV